MRSLRRSIRSKKLPHTSHSLYPVAFIAIASPHLACGNNAEQPPRVADLAPPERAWSLAKTAHHGGVYEGGGHEDHGR